MTHSCAHRNGPTCLELIDRPSPHFSTASCLIRRTLGMPHHSADRGLARGGGRSAWRAPKDRQRPNGVRGFVLQSSRGLAQAVGRNWARCATSRGSFPISAATSGSGPGLLSGSYDCEDRQALQFDQYPAGASVLQFRIGALGRLLRPLGFSARSNIGRTKGWLSNWM